MQLQMTHIPHLTLITQLTQMTAISASVRLFPDVSSCGASPHGKKGSFHAALKLRSELEDRLHQLLCCHDLSDDAAYDRIDPPSPLPLSKGQSEHGVVNGGEEAGEETGAFCGAKHDTPAPVATCKPQKQEFMLVSMLDQV